MKKKLCVCDFENRNQMTEEQWQQAEGHFNQTGGYCCPHHGNTCGYCHEYDQSHNQALEEILAGRNKNYPKL